MRDIERRVVIGVMGPGGSATIDQRDLAYEIGKSVAEHGFVLLSGGMDGTMEAACHGAHDAGGLVVGISPTKDKHDTNNWVHISVATGMGEARNVINVLSSYGIIAIAGNSGGTFTEIAHTIKHYDTPLCVIDYTSALRACLEEYEKDDNPVWFAESISGVNNFLGTTNFIGA